MARLNTQKLNKNKKTVEIEIDFSEISNLGDFYVELDKKFNFPEFYNNTPQDLFECWSNLRNTDYKMSVILFDKQEILLLKLKSFPVHNLVISRDLLIIVGEVNKIYMDKKEVPPIHLILL